MDNVPIETPDLLDRLVSAVQDRFTTDRLWLLFVAVAARYPSEDELSDGMRKFELSDNDNAALWLLDTALAGGGTGSATHRDMVLVQDSVLVDVEHSAE